MLFGGEKYVARVYVIRRANAPENTSAYQEIEFTIPPGGKTQHYILFVLLDDSSICSI
jgi:hypothetical protein